MIREWRGSTPIRKPPVLADILSPGDPPVEIDVVLEALHGLVALHPALATVDLVVKLVHSNIPPLDRVGRLPKDSLPDGTVVTVPASSAVMRAVAIRSLELPGVRDRSGPFEDDPGDGLREDAVSRVATVAEVSVDSYNTDPHCATCGPTVVTELPGPLLVQLEELQEQVET